MNAQKFVLFVVILKIKCEQDLKIRIGLPEFICDKDGGVRDISTEMTTIRLLGQDVQNVNYKFDVNFRTIGKKCINNNQRCTLLNWKSIRELDRYLKNYPLNKLQNGLIEINNTMFTPGIKYILNVTLMKSGKIIEERRLTLDYVDETVRKKVKKPMASLLLLAPDISYAYATYVVNADVNICSNITSYYFNWELTNTENTVKLPTKNAELTLPPDTFQAHQTYTIKCSLINAADDSVIAKSRQNVNVLSKGLLLRMPVKKMTTKINQPIHIKAIMKDLDNVDGDIRVSWTCVETTNNMECDYQSDSSELEMDSGFQQPGLYKISLEISKTDFTETDFCIVEVKDNSPIVDFDEIEYPFNPTQKIEIITTVYDLKSFCTLQWTSPNEDGYEPLDLSLVPGNIDEVVNVTTKEDFFLHELEEYDNGTIDKKHNLVIPPPTESWPGLKGDAKYLFRLVVTCPGEIEDFAELINETESFVTTDIVIETNAPPKMGWLEVTPLEGVAFVTTFIFKTQKGEDKDGDGPFVYKFGYLLENRDVVLWKLGNVPNCEITLPYSNGGIQTFVESCDNFNICGRVLGPRIKTTLPEKVSREVILQRFVNKIAALDYAKAIAEAFSILHSYRNVDGGATRDFISETIEKEIEKYLEMEDVSSVEDSANDLMKNINEFNSYLELSETVLNKVVELRNKLSDESEKYMSRKLLSLRSERSSYLSMSDVRNYLEISELLITTSNDPDKVNVEKENLRRQLMNYMEKLCSSMKKTQLSLELKTLIFSVEKLKKNSLNTFISIPFEGNSWQTNARIKLGNVVKNSKGKCIGKAIFRDYLGKVGTIYFADILNTTDINESADIVIYLPKNISKEGTPDCTIYRNNAWTSDCKIVQNIANYVKCSCKSLGYYYLNYKPKTTSTALMPVTIIKPTSIVALVTEKNEIHNQSLARISSGGGEKENYDTISYVVIGVSVIGIVILAVTIRKIFHDDDDENEDSDTFDFPKYAQLHNEEFLTDAHI